MKPASLLSAFAVIFLCVLALSSCKKETVDPVDEDQWRKDLTGIYIGETSRWTTPNGGNSQYMGTVADTFEVKLGPYPDKVRIDDDIFLMSASRKYFAGAIESAECDSVTGTFSKASFSWERNNECATSRIRTLFLGTKDY